MVYQRSAGYFISVSLLRMVPYDFKGIWHFMKHILPEAAYVRADFMRMREGRGNMTVYSAMITNNLVLHGDVPFSMSLLEDEIVSNISFLLGGLNMELKICFMDDSSYEVSLCAPYRDMDRMEYSYWEDLVYTFIDCIDPVYGNLGVEANICGVSEILSNEFMATDQLYLCSQLMDLYCEKLLQLFDNINTQPLRNGLFICNGCIDEGGSLPLNTQRQLGCIISEYLKQTYPEKTSGSIVSNVYESLK